MVPRQTISNHLERCFDECNTSGYDQSYSVLTRICIVREKPNGWIHDNQDCDSNLINWSIQNLIAFWISFDEWFWGKHGDLDLIFSIWSSLCRIFRSWYWFLFFSFIQIAIYPVWSDHDLETAFCLVLLNASPYSFRVKSEGNSLVIAMTDTFIFRFGNKCTAIIPYRWSRYVVGIVKFIVTWNFAY
jgi:hypothetical protein